MEGLEQSEEMKAIWKKYKKPLMIVYKHYAQMETYQIGVDSLDSDKPQFPIQFKSFVKLCYQVLIYIYIYIIFSSA